MERDRHSGLLLLVLWGNLLQVLFWALYWLHQWSGFWDIDGSRWLKHTLLIQALNRLAFLAVPLLLVLGIRQWIKLARASAL
jgi:hypothetical protein